MKTRIDIATHHFFPIQFIALGIGFIVMSFFSFEMYPYLTFGLIITGILLATTHYRIVLDIKYKKYREYVWLAGFKIGSEKHFINIKYIYLNRLRFNNEYGPFAIRYYASGTNYQGFVKLSNDEALFIGESVRKKSLLKKISKISQVLRVEVRDSV